MKQILVLAAVLSLGFGAFAEDAKNAEGKHGSHPCAEIKKACEGAGFTKGGHNKKTGANKGLFVDCMKKVMDGQAVEGVTVDATVVAACKEKKAERATKKASH